jgi:hypothetical protein
MFVPRDVPVVALMVPALIGPEKVVVPICFSCRGLSQTHHAAVRDIDRIHYKNRKRKGQLSLPLPTLRGIVNMKLTIPL